MNCHNKLKKSIKLRKISKNIIKIMHTIESVNSSIKLSNFAHITIFCNIMQNFIVKIRCSALVLSVEVEAGSGSEALILAISTIEFFIGKSINHEKVHAIIIKKKELKK